MSKSQSKSLSGTLWTLWFNCGDSFWMSKDSFIQRCASEMALPTMEKFLIDEFSLQISSCWICDKMALLFLLLGLNLKFFPVRKEIPKCSLTHTKKWRLLLPM